MGKVLTMADLKGVYSKNTQQMAQGVMKNTQATSANPGSEEMTEDFLTKAMYIYNKVLVISQVKAVVMWAEGAWPSRASGEFDPTTWLRACLGIAPTNLPMGSCRGVWLGRTVQQRLEALCHVHEVKGSQRANLVVLGSHRRDSRGASRQVELEHRGFGWQPQNQLEGLGRLADLQAVYEGVLAAHVPRPTSI